MTFNDGTANRWAFVLRTPDGQHRISYPATSLRAASGAPGFTGQTLPAPPK